MFGSETGVIELMLGCALFAVAIFYSLWRKEVNKRERQSKELLASIKHVFAKEIYMTVNSLVEIVKTILPEFARGRYSVILENITLNLSGKFLESTSLLCDRLNALSVKIDELKAKKEAIAIRAITERMMEMKILVSDYSVKNMQEAIHYNSKKSDLIKQLEIALRKLQELVANKSSELKKE